MDLQDGDHAGLDIVGFGVGGVVDIDGEPASGDVDDGCSVEIFGELLGLESGG
jgi:hypothetical protein